MKLIGTGLSALRRLYMREWNRSTQGYYSRRTNKCRISLIACNNWRMSLFKCAMSWNMKSSKD